MICKNYLMVSNNHAYLKKNWHAMSVEGTANKINDSQF